MKSKIISTIVGCCLALVVSAQQETSKDYRNFPLIVSIQFHSFSVPFKNMKSNFKNVGIGVGTEVALNGKPNWVQQLSVAWFHNKAVGNGLLFYSQMVWRPEIADDIYAETKLGVGYLLASRPVVSYRQVDGVWQSVGHRGKGMFAIPVGISLGGNTHLSGSTVSTFGSYQFLLVNQYNKSVPVVPETLIQLGTRVHFN